MRKILFSLLLLTAAACMVACGKTETPIPDDHPVKIDTRARMGDYQMTSNFTWQGDLLTAWTFTDEEYPDHNYAANIITDGTRVEAIEMPFPMEGGIRKVNFAYADGRLAEIRFGNDVAFSNFVYDHQGHLTSVDSQPFSGRDYATKRILTMQMTWDGDNVRTLAADGLTMTFFYGQAPNPMRALLPLTTGFFLGDIPWLPFYLSRKIPTGYTVTNGEQSESMPFSVSYDDKGRVAVFSMEYYALNLLFSY